MGWNNNGNLGLNDVAKRSSPTQIPGTNWSNYVVTSTKSFATKTDGTLWAWGNNFAGALGINIGGDPGSHRSSPTQIPGTTWDTGDFKIAIVNAGGGAIKTDGTLWTWGYDEYGSVGISGPANVHISSPTQVPGTTWRHVTGGAHAMLATKTDGTLWAWGANQGGQLGINEGEANRKSSPVQIPGTTWYAPFLMGSAGAATKTDGTLWSWGYNMPGHLGQNSRAEFSSPVQVGTDTTWNKDKVRFGGGVLGGLKTDGTLWLVGRNDYGQLGQNEYNVAYSSPVQVPGNYSDVGGYGWYSISALQKPTLN
jgi:alpha-tubulin suppressor-like RCC1 family protein